MTPDFPHSIRIRLAKFFFFFFESWRCYGKFTFWSMSFCGKWAWSPPANATPSDFPAPKSWVSDLSFQVSFASVLAMVLSEYWKRLENFFWNYIFFLQFPQNIIIMKKKIPAFFNILKEPLLVQKQTIPEKTGLILSFLELGSLRAWH